MSSGSPMRPSGHEATIASRKRSSVAAIILLSNGPGATAFTVMRFSASFIARTRVMWCTAAFLPGCAGARGEPVAPRSAAGVGGNGVPLAVGRQLLRALLAVLRLARRDVDLAPVLDEAGCDHQPDAARPAGDERHLAFDREQVL